MSRIFIHEAIPVGDAARRETDHKRLTQVGPVTTPHLHQLATESQQAADTFVSSQAIERLDGLAADRVRPGIERVDGDSRAEERRRQEAEAEARSAAGSAATDVVVERVSGEPESSR